MSRVLGVDPGVKGALAVIRTPGGAPVSLEAVFDLPTYQTRVGGRNKTEILEQVLATMIEELLPLERAYIEEVHAMPGQGVSSTFRFGQATGLLRGLVVAHGIPLVSIRPAVWKKACGIKARADKDASRAWACAMFPSFTDHFRLKKHADRADAVGIAYGGIFNGHL